MKSKTKKPSQKKTTTLPICLVALASMLDERNREVLSNAFAAARQAMKHLATGGPEAAYDPIHDYIEENATTGPYSETVQKALALDPGNMEGDLHNAYGTPALLAGMAFAYLVMGGSSR